MILTKIKIKHFRNIEGEELFFPKMHNLLIGENGQGKTNLLEAIYAVVRGKSFRFYSQKSDWKTIHHREQLFTEKSALSDEPSKVIHHDEQLSTVEAQLENSRGFTMDLLLKSEQNKRWQHYFNGKKAKQSLFHEQIPIVVFSPDDHELIRGGPEVRRKFLDDLFSDICPGYAEILSRFEDTLSQRNKLLKKLEEEPLLMGELKVWTEVYANAAAELVQLRREIWPRFTENFMKYSGDIFDPEDTRFHIEYLSDITPNEGVFEQVMANVDADKATGWTHRGPHRDDFIINFNDLVAKNSASQGQARLLALLLKWIHSKWVTEERKESPIFLIDDFSSELDAKRRKLLLKLVNSLSGQIFITSTEASLVDLETFSDYTYFSVEKGKFTAKIDSKN